MSAACRNQASQTLSPRPAAPTRFMPSFQSPVPNSGSPCEPILKLESSASAQCSYRAGFAAVGFGAAKSSCCPGCERSALEEGNRLLEQGEVLGHFEIVGDHVRQPDPIVGNARLDALIGDREPPVLDVACARTGGTPRARCARVRFRAGRSQSAITSCNWSRYPQAPLD